jgi:hypothetical protein
MNITANTFRIWAYVSGLGVFAALAAHAEASYAIADQADAVVVGDVQSGRQAGYSFNVALTVVRAIKGTPLPGSVLSISGSCAQSINKDLAGSYGMFFLVSVSTTEWRLVPVANTTFEATYFPLVRAASPADILITTTATTVSDRIAVELVAALRAHSASPRLYGSFQLYALGSGFIQVPDSPVVQDLLRGLRANSDPELRFLALARALKAGDSSALAEVASGVDVLPGLTARIFVLPGIYGQRDSSPATIGNLGRIAESSNADVQRSAADALMRIHTLAALPFLAQLLDSRDARTRELAMAGLSRFVENLPIETQYNTINAKAVQPQGPAVYRTSETDRYSLSTRRLVDATEPETAFLQFWKVWWISNRSQLGF